MKLIDLTEGVALQDKNPSTLIKNAFYQVQRVYKVGRWTVFDLAPLIKGGNKLPIGLSISEIKKQFRLCSHAEVGERRAEPELPLGYMQGRGAA